MGDNGTSEEVIQSPYVSNRSKGSIYQGGIAVPLIVSGKGVSRIGVRDANLINSTDLFTTIAQIAGINVNAYENSKSFYTLLSQAISNNRTYNYSEILNNSPTKSGYTIRDNTYKLLVFDDETERFYNLNQDPYETNNIINNLTYEEQVVYNNLKTEVNLTRE